MNGLQDRTPYAGHPVGNIPEFMSLDISLNREILHSLSFRFVLIRFLQYGEGTEKEGMNMRFSVYTPKEIDRGLKRIFIPSLSVPSPSSKKRLKTQ